MRYRVLGSTGLQVSEIGFGAWAIGGSMWGPQDDTDSKLALHRALDQGCLFIDTALVYGDGHSEKLIASVLRDRSEKPVLASKIPPKNWQWDVQKRTPLSEAFPADWVTAKTEESLRNLGVDCLQVQQLHTWSAEWNSQCEPLLSAVAKLKREGKIRAFGISLRDKGSDEANDLIRWRQVDTLQIFFNLFYQEPIVRVFPLAKKYGVGVIARVPLAFGALSGKFNLRTKFTGDDHRTRLYQGAHLKTTLAKVEKLKFLKDRGRTLAHAALQWTLAFPEVSTSIPGIRNPRQAALNCAAGNLPPLSPALVQKTRKLYAVNFNQPLMKISSDSEVHAVFMSGIKLSVPKKAKVKKTKLLLKNRKSKKTKKDKGKIKGKKHGKKKGKK
jgi:aryl-alcohol dehydrogenase-like predicted oxidoreductase